ncbi:SNF2 family N-terminal domain-containing protein [Fennellomyces sp. T-0311]|nr:SNF2 family N-terminal domain-containing protein [Fennellomyces sp. T-0311]
MANSRKVPVKKETDRPITRSRLTRSAAAAKPVTIVVSDDEDDFQSLPITRRLRSAASSSKTSLEPPQKRQKNVKDDNEDIGKSAAAVEVVDRKGKGKMVSSSSSSTPSHYTTEESNWSDTGASSPSTSINQDSSSSDDDLDSDYSENDNKETVKAAVKRTVAAIKVQDSSTEDSADDATSDVPDDSTNVAADSSDSSDDDTTDDGRVPGPEQPQRRRVFSGLSNAQKTNALLLEHHPELAEVWDALDAESKVEVVPVNQPAELKLPLLNFQKYGVGWMRQQEELNDFKGGVLADEMGMGKTIQTIALLLSDRKKPNLVIAPTVAIMQWKKEIEQHTDNLMKVLVFHGAKRDFTTQDIKEYDVVLTTYSLLENEFRRQESGTKKDGRIIKKASILHKIKWHRVILDEAHSIKDRACNTARACFNLEGTFRWSLTGTPLQNRVGELYSLIRFMQADPFGYYYCKSCPCKKINWEFSDKRGCDTCGHIPMDHVCWWNNEVLKPIQNYGNMGEGRVAMEKLRKLLDKMMLRRTKIECADDLGLPPRTVVVRRDMFNEEEEDVYTSLYSDTARQFTTYVEEGSVLNNYANIFELLTRMRLCANHPDLVTKKKDNSDNKQLVCMLCSEPPEDAISAACRHVFCRECCIQYMQSFDSFETDQQPKCPTCFSNFSVDLSQPPLELESGRGTHSAFSKTSIVNRIDMDKWRSSTKIEALVEELSNLRREDRTIKSIVFSQFVNFLDLVHWRLSRAGFECIRLDGTMTPQQRDAAINHFMTKPSVTVFLISLKAGGVALNLTEASRVFICDPWWNPAMDRIHRLGQRRPIRITRLVIENSIESRIVQLQDKKMALVDSTLGKDTSALERLSVEDLRFLFVL